MSTIKLYAYLRNTYNSTIISIKLQNNMSKYCLNANFVTYSRLRVFKLIGRINLKLNNKIKVYYVTIFVNVQYNNTIHNLVPYY